MCSSSASSRVSPAVLEDPEGRMPSWTGHNLGRGNVGGRAELGRGRAFQGVDQPREWVGVGH